MSQRFLNNAILAGSLILCSGGIWSFTRTDNSPAQHSLALSIAVASGTTAIGCVVFGALYGAEAEEKIKKAKQNYETEISGKQYDVNKAKNTLEEIRQEKLNLERQLEKHLYESNFEIEKRDTAIQILNKKVKNVEAEYLVKVQEINQKLQIEDKRLEEFLMNFKQSLYAGLINKIETLEILYAEIERKLNDENFTAVHPALAKRLVELQSVYDKCNEMMRTFERLDITAYDVMLEYFWQITTDISSVKVRYRNSLNSATQQRKEELENLIIHSVSHERAKATLKEYSEFQRKQLDDLILKVDESNTEWKQLKDALLKDLETAHLEIDKLNQQIAELQKPLLAIGTSDYALAANRIANYYHEHYGYKLDVMNWTENETGYSILFATRRNPGLTEDELLPHNTQEQLAAFTNCLQGTLPKFTFNYQHSTITLDVILRKPVTKEVTVEDIFRECSIIRAELFGQTIRKYHIEKTGKPTLRVMSATGGGKGIAVKNLLDYYLHNLDGYEIWFSDPQHGSDEDHWDCEKAATAPNQASNLFSQFAQLLRARDAKTSTDPKTPILAIFDEFDKKHDLKDKKTVSEIWTTIRHHNMRLVLVGQSAEVGRNGWQWDEMNNCCLLFISNAIDTFIKHADKDLGMNSETLEKFSKHYNKASKWIAKANEDISPENQYRLAALYCNGQALLLEIPVAHKGMLTDGKSWLASKPFEKVTQMSTNNQKSVISNILNQVQNEVENDVLKPVIACLHCDSINVKKNGKDKATKTIQQYKCNDCGKEFGENKLSTNSN